MFHEGVHKPLSYFHYLRAYLTGLLWSAAGQSDSSIDLRPLCCTCPIVCYPTGLVMYQYCKMAYKMHGCQSVVFNKLEISHLSKNKWRDTHLHVMGRYFQVFQYLAFAIAYMYKQHNHTSMYNFCVFFHLPLSQPSQTGELCVSFVGWAEVDQGR